MIISGCQKLSRTSGSCGEQQLRAAKDAGQERVFKLKANAYGQWFNDTIAPSSWNCSAFLKSFFLHFSNSCHLFPLYHVKIDKWNVSLTKLKRSIS